MFERYTDKARRVVYFARYEASQLGSSYIETEHLLLGFLQEDKVLRNRILPSDASAESVRQQIKKHLAIREKISTSVDLPLSQECKRVLTYAAEESELLSHKHIGSGHLLLGILREENSFAAGILHGYGLTLSAAREEVTKSSAPGKSSAALPSHLEEFSRDLTKAAEDRLDLLIGHDHELDGVMEILCSRNNRNPILIGERGAGKTAIVEGLAQRIARGDVPSFLADSACWPWISRLSWLARSIVANLRSG